MHRADFLDKVKTIVTQERTGHYGEPEDTFTCIAQFWSSYLGITIDEKQVAMMMGLLKIARQRSNPNYLDSYLDLAGYGACAAEFLADEKKG